MLKQVRYDEPIFRNLQNIIPFFALYVLKKIKKMKKYKLFCLLMGCIVAISSCGEKKLSDQNFIDFALNIEEQIMNYENDNPIVNAFDYEEFEKRVLVGIDISKKERNRASKFIRENTNPATSILESVANGADFRFIKFYRKDNEPHVVFRTYFNGWISLEDWTLGVKKGQIFIYDAFVIISGIKWSDECRQKLCNYLGIFTDEVLNINKLMEIKYLIASEDYTTADSLLYWIMPQMQNNLYAKTMEMNLYWQSKSYEDVQTLAKGFIKMFPNEKPISAFYLMKSSILHGLADETMKHIYTLIDLIGDDPIYYLYLSEAYQQANATTLALQMLDSAICYMPLSIDLYSRKLDIYYSNYNYQACMDLVYQIDSLCVLEDEDAAFFQTNYPQLNGYAPFNEWLQLRKK